MLKNKQLQSRVMILVLSLFLGQAIWGMVKVESHMLKRARYAELSEKRMESHRAVLRRELNEKYYIPQRWISSSVVVNH